MKSNFLFTICLFFLSFGQLLSQANTDDFFRSTGKINTVLAVVVILFFVLIAFLFRLDRKIDKLEKQMKDE